MSSTLYSPSRFALLLAAGLCTTAHAQCTDVYRTDLTDLDQRREADQGILGLPWNGGSHCVPSSWADNLTYMSNHGLPSLMQNVTYNWADPATYNDAGVLIFYLGLLMNTTSGGTYDALPGLKVFANERAPGALVFGSKKYSQGDVPAPKHMHELLLAGGYGVVSRGFYAYPENTVQFVRTGGHALALRGVHDVCATKPLISMRDPNSADSKFVQSPFATYSERVNKETHLFLVDGILENRTVWVWDASNELNAIKVFDGFRSCIPTVALTGQPIIANQPTIMDFIRPLNLSDPLHPTHSSSNMPAGTGSIKAIHIDPSLAFAWVLADNTTTGGTRILRVGMGTGAVETKFETTTPVISSFVSHDGAVYIASGREISRLALDADEQMASREHILLARQTIAIAEDDSTQQIVMIQESSTGPVICRHPLRLAAPLDSGQPCPSGVTFSGPTSLAINPETGEILCCSQNVPSLFRLTTNSTGGWQLLQDITLPAGSQPGCPTWNDTGTLLFTNNGSVHELERDPSGAWLPKAGSYYHGTPVAPDQVFTIATTRPASEIAVEVDGDRSTIADEQLQSFPDFCSSDFNADGDTGTDADIEAFFACLGGQCCALCGSSDYNGDGDFGTDADIEAFFRVLGGGNC